MYLTSLYPPRGHIPLCFFLLQKLLEFQHCFARRRSDSHPSKRRVQCTRICSTPLLVSFRKHVRLLGSGCKLTGHRKGGIATAKLRNAPIFSGLSADLFHQAEGNFLIRDAAPSADFFCYPPLIGDSLPLPRHREIGRAKTKNQLAEEKEGWKDGRMEGSVVCPDTSFCCRGWAMQ